MAFSRFGRDSDVYVYDTEGPEAFRCENCRLRQGSPFTTAAPVEMLRHLLHHRDAGHNVPETAIRELVEIAAAEIGFELWLGMEGAQAASLCVCADRLGAWIMFLREPGDSGLRTVGDGTGGAGTMKVRLENGQVDCYPRAWTVSIEAAFGAGLYFLRHGEPDPKLGWTPEQ